ncbi:MAG: holo-ACP synthase [Dehalococcoidales bacterium]|nr:holo-ACP synthase [Dehalococcoidales bacterium]
MHSLGVDIIEIERIEKAVERFGKRFLHRVYTDAELSVCRNKPSRLASRFAAKEAVMKSLGTGTKGVGWREIEILHDAKGKPLVSLCGKARNRAEDLGLGELAVSLSDSRDYAVAFVIGETPYSLPFAKGE